MLGDLLDYRFFLKQRTDIRFVIIASRHPAIAMFFLLSDASCLASIKDESWCRCNGCKVSPCNALKDMEV